MHGSFDVKKKGINIILGAFAATFAACSFVSLNPQAENTTVLLKGALMLIVSFWGIPMCRFGQKLPLSKVRKKPKASLIL